MWIANPSFCSVSISLAFPETCLDRGGCRFFTSLEVGGQRVLATFCDLNSSAVINK